MISNLSLSAFSATDLRPSPSRLPPDRGAAIRPASERPPVEPAPSVNRVRAQSDTRPAPEALALGASPPAPSGKPAPRGSLLDLSV